MPGAACHGADLTAQYIEQYTPMHEAALHGHAGTCQAQRAVGADMTALGEQANTAMHLAAVEGHSSGGGDGGCGGGNISRSALRSLEAFAVSTGAAVVLSTVNVPPGNAAVAPLASAPQCGPTTAM